MRRVAVLACLLGGFLAVTAQAVTRPAQAASPAPATRALTCPVYHYSLTIPSNWTVAKACTVSTTITTSLGIAAMVIVTSASSWSASTARSDMAEITSSMSGVKQDGRPSFSKEPVHGIVWSLGKVDLQDLQGHDYALTVLETFDGGYVYDVAAVRALTGKATVDKELAQIVAAVYASAELSSAGTGAPNGTFPAELVGSWTSNGYVSSTDFVDAATGTYAPASGTIDRFTFSASGQFRHSNLAQSSLYNCTTSLFWDAKGSTTVDNSLLVLTPDWSTETAKDTCNASPSHNYVKAHSLKPQSYYWKLDEYQRGLKLCLLHRATGAKPNCYWRDGKLPTQPTVVDNGAGGAGWASVASGTKDDLYGAGCTPNGDCLAVGEELHDSLAQPEIHDTVIDGSTDGGATWHAQIAHPAKDLYLHAATCSADNCMAVGYQSYALDGGVYTLGAVLSTANGGTLWTTPGADGFIELNGASCATATSCVAVGYQELDFNARGIVMNSRDGGANWTVQTVGSRRLRAVSCARNGVCVAVGEKGAIVTSTDDGTTWQGRVLRSGVWLNGVSCPSAGLCVAVGGLTDGLVLKSTDGGTSWSSYSSGFDDLLSEEGPANAEILQCAAGGGCADGALRGISCPSTRFCVAVGDQGTILTTADGATTWTSQVASGGSSTKQLTGVSCVSRTDCVAVGQGGIVLRMN